MSRNVLTAGLVAVPACLAIAVYLRLDSPNERPESTTLRSESPNGPPEVRTSSKANAGRQTGGPKRIIPWIQVNIPTMLLSRIDPALPEAIGRIPLDAFCLQGIEFWKRVTDTVIITTTLSRAGTLYQDILRQLPPTIRIVGGVKTYTLPGARSSDKRPYDFADPSEWRRIAAAVAEIARITGNNTVVLENETALMPYHRGEGDIDLEKLRRSLAPLRDTGVTIWWYLPTILPNSRRMPHRKAMTKMLVESVFQAVPNSIFFTPYVDRPDWVRDEASVQRRQAMIDIVGAKRIYEMFQVRPDGFLHPRSGKKVRCFGAAEIGDQISRLPGDTFILHTGAIHWVSVGRAFANLLPARPKGGGSNAGGQP